MSAVTHAIDGQLTPNRVLDASVLEAISAVDRAQFVPESHAEQAYSDRLLPLGNGRMMLPPLTFSHMMQVAKFEEGNRVLYIGAGTGYGPAVIAPIVKGVCAVEEMTDGAESARRFFSCNRAMDVEVFTGALAAGHPENAPYDRIFVEGAIELLPNAILEQLADGGVCVAINAEAPVASDGAVLGCVVTFTKDGEQLRIAQHDQVYAPVLPGFEKHEEFSL